MTIRDRSTTSGLFFLASGREKPTRRMGTLARPALTLRVAIFLPLSFCLNSSGTARAGRQKERGRKMTTRKSWQTRHEAVSGWGESQRDGGIWATDWNWTGKSAHPPSHVRLLLLHSFNFVVTCVTNSTIFDWPNGSSPLAPALRGEG
jgi:hypothetical protein